MGLGPGLLLRGRPARRAPGQPFHDREADAALFEELDRSFVQTEQRRFNRLPLHINDPEFADAAARRLLALMRRL